MVAQEHTQNQSPPSVKALFGHAETVLPLLCLLGLYQEHGAPTDHYFGIRSHFFLFGGTGLGYVFKQNASESLRQQRQFRTSQIGPFAANVVFSMYQCPTDKEKSSRGAVTHRVLVRHNGEQVNILERSIDIMII